jgi:UDP-N-acetylglucosamine 4,6-dehydratase
MNTPKTAQNAATGFPGADLTGENVLETGGTGSFGQAFVRHVLASGKPERLIIFSCDEQKQFDTLHALSVQSHPCLRYFTGDVRNRDRRHMVMRGVDYVIQPAALKHVPAAE